VGRLPIFHAVVKPLGETRPAWKVLRVLANLMGMAGFDFETSQDVLNQATAMPLVFSNASQGPLQMTGDVAEPNVARIYQLDGLVRRAPSLQMTADARLAQEVLA